MSVQEVSNILQKFALFNPEISERFIYRSVHSHMLGKANMNNNKLTAHELFTESLSQDNLLTIATTVDTGFEPQAAAECKEKFNKNMKVAEDRGKIYFNLQWEQFAKVQEMRSIDNIFIVGDVHKFKLSGTDKTSDLKVFENYVQHNLNLEKYLNAWKQFSGFQGILYPTTEEFERTYNKLKLLKNEGKVVESQKNRKRGRSPSNSTQDDIVAFRVTCERNGTHSFMSTELATLIGGGLQDKYKWIVDLSTYHLEIFCKINDDELVTLLRVTSVSKHHRNIIYFGATTLRSTICYNLLRLARPQLGDVIIDPMCGSGSIPIEAASAYTQSHVICGDNHSKSVNRTKANIDSFTFTNKPEALLWDATRLPLTDSSIDIVVSDLPFGRRMGRVSDNRILYKLFLIELGRTVKISTGRIVLLTHDRRSFNTAMQATRDLFKVANMVAVNIGGLTAVAYVLKRSDMPYEKFQLRKSIASSARAEKVQCKKIKQEDKV